MVYFFRFIVPQIDENLFKFSYKDSCTKISRRYNTAWYVASARLNYYESQGWYTSALRKGIARIRDDFEYSGYKNGCEEIEGKEKVI